MGEIARIVQRTAILTEMHSDLFAKPEGASMAGKDSFTPEEWAIVRPVFLQSVRGHLDTIRTGLTIWTTGGASPERLRELHRSMHSLKGAALQLGFEHLGETARLLEQVLRQANESLESAWGWEEWIERGLLRLQDAFTMIERDQEETRDARFVADLQSWLTRIQETRPGERAG